MTPLCLDDHMHKPIPEHAEAAARVFTKAARLIRGGESVQDVINRMGLIDVVTALSGRI